MIKVLKAGFYTTIQDQGRVGFASIGVPVSGVMDSYAANLANKVLNNNVNDALLEIAFSGCKLEFLTKTIICISGADFSSTINNHPIQLNTRITVFKNDVLSFGKVNFGSKCYVAVKGGFLTEKVLNSRSFYKNITHQNLIKTNDILPINSFKVDVKSSNTSINVDKNHFNSATIKCFKGPEFNLLNTHQKKQLLEQIFTISKNNNRMGYQLNEVIKNKLPSILTSAVLPGTVQLTPSGTLIVLMRDCQVTGGYPRVLQLSEEGINRVAQKFTNNQLQFLLQ